MSTEEILKMNVYKESPKSKIVSKDEAQTASVTTPVPAPTQTQTQQKSTTASIPPSSGGQQNVVQVLPSTPQQKQDPVTIHPNPLPIQPAPITPQHVQQQTPQVQQHTPLRTNSLSATTTPQTTPSGKPPVGSEEWHRQRRENHKEVERRRRDTINAVQYIQQLKENEAANIEKWTLEKLLTDQAIQELQTQVEMLKTENGRLRIRKFGSLLGIEYNFFCI
ncbi:helix-loop-helix DNA-binding domain-containing transcription factor [Rhizophagus clarus]|uniref:Helix-loop-helix DNA-binding domain-containing transcription factor n=1 Tax=Rhizophagus clarus TaxID=94130 RepID=A0A8H3L0E5_9GLOM|nr:helix-loop-helix DNA-binding domain-containing transcription factor [Rhizophagus clarus]